MINIRKIGSLHIVVNLLGWAICCYGVASRKQAMGISCPNGLLVDIHASWALFSLPT
jgi:hypothetical protein